MSATELRVYSEKYPPMNRVLSNIDLTDILVVDDKGPHRYHPTTAVHAAHSGPKGFSLGAPITVSDISGEPGYFVKYDKVQLALTAAEMVRLFMTNLRPNEFFALARKYGLFYEISNKFYDEDTGVAWDPRLTFEEQDERAALAGVPHLLVIVGQPPSLHSIVTLDQADALIPLFADTFSMRAVALRLHAPDDDSADPRPLNPFKNVVKVFTSEDGDMRAYGPFKSAHVAAPYVPSDDLVNGETKWQFAASGTVLASCGSPERHDD